MSWNVSPYSKTSNSTTGAPVYDDRGTAQTSYQMVRDWPMGVAGGHNGVLRQIYGSAAQPSLADRLDGLHLGGAPAARTGGEKHHAREQEQLVNQQRLDAALRRELEMNDAMAQKAKELEDARRRKKKPAVAKLKRTIPPATAKMREIVKKVVCHGVSLNQLDAYRRLSPTKKAYITRYIKVAKGPAIKAKKYNVHFPDYELMQPRQHNTDFQKLRF